MLTGSGSKILHFPNYLCAALLFGGSSILLYTIISPIFEETIINTFEFDVTK